jgi:hypothetical protein
MHADRRTDWRGMTKVIGAFCECAEVPKLQFIGILTELFVPG